VTVATSRRRSEIETLHTRSFDRVPDSAHDSRVSSLAREVSALTVARPLRRSRVCAVRHESGNATHALLAVSQLPAAQSPSEGHATQRSCDVRHRGAGAAHWLSAEQPVPASTAAAKHLPVAGSHRDLGHTTPSHRSLTEAPAQASSGRVSSQQQRVSDNFETSNSRRP
jgi:hypothetical protein